MHTTQGKNDYFNEIGLLLRWVKKKTLDEIWHQLPNQKESFQSKSQTVQNNIFRKVGTASTIIVYLITGKNMTLLIYHL